MVPEVVMAARSRVPRWIRALIRFVLVAAILAPAEGIAQAGLPFVDQSHVFPGRVITSAPLVLAGIGQAAAVNVYGGSYSIGCAEPYVSSPGFADDGQSICVRHFASPSAGAATSTVLTVGAASGTFTSTTASSNVLALVADYYRNALRREPDAAGLAFWESESNRLVGLGVEINALWRAMAISFFESPEYRAFARDDTEFIVDLYKTFFARSPDAQGIAYWMGVIQSGVPRQAALLSFLFSEEFANYTQSIFTVVPTRAEADLVVDYYRGSMNRLPDTDGFNFWRARFREAQCLGTPAVIAEVESIASLFFGSPEYLGRNRTDLEYVTDLYNSVLRRGGDAEGIQYWSNQLSSGAQGREQLRRAFMNSVEFLVRVARVVEQPCLLLRAKSSTLATGPVAIGASPFIGLVDLQGSDREHVVSVRATVAPKAGSASRPASALFATAYLARSGYVDDAAGLFRVPVYGLYSNHLNQIELEVKFDDGSVKPLATTIASPAYSDPSAIYDRPTILKQRLPGTPLGFDFMYVKSGLGAPVVIDTDGEIRWTVPGPLYAISSAFDGSAFILGDPLSTGVRRLELDGRIASYTVAAPYTYFHHNLEPGKYGYLGEFDWVMESVTLWESILVEFGAQGEVFGQWDLGEILSAHMLSYGDDPSQFVRPGIDWFHMNSAIYDPRDDSLILSSRENFVIKIDYRTGRPLWILGDPNKYWFTFPSLRAISLEIPDGGLQPIGQHALHILPDGRLLLFNNGIMSFNNPPGTSPGGNLPYSVVSAYTIDDVARTARETWRFDYGGTIRSSFCSSAYPGLGSMLVTYAYTNAGATARLVGIDDASQVVFDFAYSNNACQTAYNAEPIEFDDLRLN